MDSKNNNHNSNFLSKQSKDENSYRYDNFGNIIADSIDDLIYDKHLRIKNQKSKGRNIKLYDKSSYTSNSSSSPQSSISKKEKYESEENNHKLKYNDNKSHNLISTINNNKYSSSINSSNEEYKKAKSINIKKNNIISSQNNDNDSKIQYDFKNKDNSTNKEDNGITNDKTLKSNNTNKDINLININTFDDNNDSNRAEKIGKLENVKQDQENEDLPKEKEEINKNNFVYYENENDKFGKKKLKKITFIIETEYDNNKENKKTKKYNKSMNISLHNEDNKINKSFKFKDSKSIVLKLRLNSNNTSVESFDILNDDNKIENNKSKNKYVLENPISPISYVNKLRITSKKTVKNSCYFCTKQNITVHQYNFKKSEFPINITNRLNKKNNKIFTKIKINKNKYSSALNKKILSHKKIPKQKNLKKFKLNNNNNIINKTIIKTSKLKRNFIIKSRLSSNKNKNIPLLSINNTNGEIFKINLESEKDNIFENKNNEHYQMDENDQNYRNNEKDFYEHHLRNYPKHWGNEKKCPLCIEMAKKSKKNEYKIFGINNSIKLKKFKFKYINNMKYKTIFNKNINNLIRYEEMNKLKMTNNNDNNLINSNSFLNNNNLILSQEFMFYYDDSKFLWKELMKISTKYIERSRDISLIEPYVQNILSSRLYPDDIDLLSNEYIVQLVTLLQLTGQYLVYTQKKLESDTIELKERINDLEYEHKESERLQKMVNDLRRQNQEKDFIVKTYQDMIKGGYGLSNPIDDQNLVDDDNINLRSKKEVAHGSDKQKYYFCKICSGKKFRSQQYLDDHMQRRHFYEMQSGQYEETKVNKDKRYKQTFDEKLNSMRDYFENMFKASQDNKEFEKINKKIDDIQSKIISQNTNSNFGSNFNYNYSQKDINLRNMNNQNPQPTIIISPKRERNANQDDYTDQLNEMRNLFYTYKTELDNQLKEQKNMIEKNKLNGSHSNSNTKKNILNRNKTEETNIKHTNIYTDNKIKIDTNAYTKSLTESSQKETKQNNPYNKQNASSSKKVSFLNENINIIPNNLRNVNSGNEDNNQNIVLNQKQKNNSNNNNYNINEEDDKVDNTNKLIHISTRDDQDGDKKILNEEDKKHVNNNEGNDESSGIYDQAKNTNSPKFSTNDKIKENLIVNNNINSLYQKLKKRDNGYKGNKDNYKPIEIASIYNADNNDKIEKEVKNKFDFGNINFQGVNDLIKEFPSKVEQYKDDKKYEIDIYKALGLDEVFQDFNDYKQNYLKNSQSNSGNNISVIKNNISGYNNTTTNYYYNNDISKNRGNFRESKAKKYDESSLSLIKNNLEQRTLGNDLNTSEM